MPPSAPLLNALSSEIAALAAQTEQSVVGIEFARGRTSGFFWNAEVIVTASDALEAGKDDAVKVRFATGDVAEARSARPRPDDGCGLGRGRAERPGDFVQHGIRAATGCRRPCAWAVGIWGYVCHRLHLPRRTGLAEYAWWRDSQATLARSTACRTCRGRTGDRYLGVARRHGRLRATPENARHSGRDH